MGVAQVVKGLLPPYALSGYRLVRNRISPPPQPPSIEEQLEEDSLFDGDDTLFKSLVRQSEIYGEYGCGRSTIWTARNSNAIIYSVDTSREWISRVTNLLGEQTRKPALEWVDLGPVEHWGRPKTYAKRKNICNYLDSIWNHPKGKPDTVLIDGRFRVACFLSTLQHSVPGTKIIFDDYTNRPRYHLVEELVSVSETCGRQALFVTPETIDEDKVRRELIQFQYVME